MKAIVIFCCNDTKAITVSSESFSKLGKDIDGYVYGLMWAGPPKYDGVCDVEETIAGVIRTEGFTINFNGAWAQNVGENEMYIDFLGTKAGIRLHYGADFIKYGTQDGMLTKTLYSFEQENMFQNEIDAFAECISGEKLPLHIDTNIITAKLMDAIYKLAELHREVIEEE